MLAAIFKTLGGGLIDKLIDPFTDLFKAYLNKEISKDQLRTQLLQTLLTSVTEIEKAHADSLAKTFDSFTRAASQSPQLMLAWTIVIYSQLAVLLWHQVGIPAIVFFGWKYPSSGTTVEWAYLLLAGLMGLGAFGLRAGPARLDVDKFKALIGK